MNMNLEEFWNDISQKLEKLELSLRKNQYQVSLMEEEITQMLTPEQQWLKIQDKLEKYIQHFDEKLSPETEFPNFIEALDFDRCYISMQYLRLLKNHYTSLGWKVEIFCQCDRFNSDLVPRERQHKKRFYCENNWEFLKFSFPGPLTKFYRHLKKILLNIFAPKILLLPPRKSVYRN